MIQGPLTVVVGLWCTVHFANCGYLTMENLDKIDLGKTIS